MTSSAIATAPFVPRWGWLRAPIVAVTLGVMILGYGLILVGITSVYWSRIQPPGSNLGPPSLVQELWLRITEAIYLGVFGAILAGGGFMLGRRERRAEVEGRTHPGARWRSLLALGAVALTATAAAVGAFPTPEWTVTFEPSDFQLRALAEGGPYEWYFVSRAFGALKGEALFPGVSITWTEDSTGALIQRDTFVTAYVTTPSEFPDLNQRSGTGN